MPIGKSQAKPNPNAFTADELDGIVSRVELLMRSKDVGLHPVAWAYIDLMKAAYSLGCMADTIGLPDETRTWSFTGGSRDKGEV